MVIETAALVKAAAPLAGQVSKSIFATLQKQAKDMKDDILHAISNAFAKYIEASYLRHSFFSPLVFPNQQKRLKDYYLPLTLMGPKNLGGNTYVVNDYPSALLVDKKDTLIVDTAGMGKSTVMKFMFLRAVELDVGIPIFLELRKLSPSRGILDAVFEQLSSLVRGANEDLIRRVMESGGFVFFLDGYDEIADEHRGPVTDHIREFKTKANKNIFVISSRDQPGLAQFSDFFRVTIRPLNVPEAEKLIQIYAQDNSSLADALIDKIRLPENKPIHEFLANPLLVSLLFKAYEFKPTIPLKKHVFYRQVFEALFENHDLSKDTGELTRSKLSGLDIHSFEIAMRALGFLSLQSSKVEYPKDELLLLVEKIRKLAPTLDFKPQAFIQDLVTRVPLFVVEGNLYRWNHKSLQEYFAALYVSAGGRETQERVLSLMRSSPRALNYHNFFSLFADIDEKGFRHVVVRGIATEMLREFVQPAPAAEGVPLEARWRRTQLTAFRHEVMVEFTKEEWQVAGRRSLFQMANDLLPGDVGTKLMGEHMDGPRTVVVYYLNSFALTERLLRQPGLPFAKLVPAPRMTSLAAVPPPKLPPGLHGLHYVGKDVSDPVNLAGNYAEVNEFLGYSVSAIEFDHAAATQLLAEVSVEIESEQAIALNF